MKRFLSIILALALVMSVMLTGCSGSVTIPDTNIELGFSMSQKDIEKLLGAIQGNTSSSDKDEDKDDDDTDYPTVGSVDIRNTTIRLCSLAVCYLETASAWSCSAHLGWSDKNW